jgi:hypothetical protein
VAHKRAEELAAIALHIVHEKIPELRLVLQQLVRAMFHGKANHFPQRQSSRVKVLRLEHRGTGGGGTIRFDLCNKASTAATAAPFGQQEYRQCKVHEVDASTTLHSRPCVRGGDDAMSPVRLTQARCGCRVLERGDGGNLQATGVQSPQK